MNAASTNPSLDLEYLMKVRLVVARLGEASGNRWWNTDDLLGRKGSVLMGRGFAKTHRFAQARVVFMVARTRCNEVFNPPHCATLWNLPAALEDEFDAQWQSWLDDAQDWEPFFQELEALQNTDLLDALRQFELLNHQQEDSIASLKRSLEGRGVQIPGTFEATDEVIGMLAAGFCRGEPGKPSIPYARMEC